MENSEETDLCTIADALEFSFVTSGWEERQLGDEMSDSFRHGGCHGRFDRQLRPAVPQASAADYNSGSGQTDL